jgi:hypothetical protein
VRFGEAKDEVLSGFSSEGLLLADFPNSFRSVFRPSGCPPRGRCCSQADLPKPATGNRLAGFVEHIGGYPEMKIKTGDSKGIV